MGKLSYEELDNFEKSQLKNITKVNHLFRSIIYSNNQKSNNQFYHLNYSMLFSGYSETGLLYSSIINTTYEQQKGVKVQIYDPRAQNWYIDTFNQESTVFHAPQLEYTEPTPYVGQLSCQKLVLHNYKLKKDYVNHVLCFSLKISEFQNFLREYQQKQMVLYVLDPNSFTIVFDSTDTTDYKKINYLFDKYPLSPTEDYLFRELVKGLQRVEQERFNMVNLTYLFDIHSNASYVQKSVNGINFFVFSNPVYIIDKLPKYISSLDNQSNKQFKYIMVYLQTGSVTDSKLRQWSNEILEYSKRLIIGISITMFILLFIFTLISIYYSLFINRILHAPIEKITSILKRLANQKLQNNFYFVLSQITFDERDAFLSKEIYNLSMSIKQVFQLLLQISQNYYKSNIAETLIRLNNNISFFKSSQNYYALGITHNNIGSILLNQEYYTQSLEHFESSIIYARYEIQEFCIQHPNSKSIGFLRQYCYDDQFDKLIQQAKKQRQQSIDSIDEEQYTPDFSVPNQKPDQEKRESIRSIKQKKPSMFSKLFNRSKYKPQSKIDINLNEKRSSSPRNPKKIQLVDIFGNYLQTEQDEYDVLFQGQEDEFYELGIQLILNIFYRKYNYTFALLGLQNSIEENNKNQHKLKHSEMLFNYWNEIKMRLKEVIKIAQNFHLSQQHLLILYSNLKICYNKLEKNHKIDVLNEKMRVLKQQFISRVFKRDFFLNLDQSQKIDETVQNNKLFEFEIEEIENSKKINPKNQNIGSSVSIIQKKQELLKKRTLQSPRDENNQQSQLIEEGKQSTVQMSLLYQKKIKKQMSQSFQKQNERIQQFQFEDNNLLSIENTHHHGTRDRSHSPSSFSKLRQKTISNNMRNKQITQSNKMSDLRNHLGNSNNNQTSFEQTQKNLKRLYIKDKYETFVLKQSKLLNQLEKRNILEENIEIIVQLSQVDILVSENKYAEAAEILTGIIESSSALFSRFSFIIIKKLKEIFIHYGIYSKDLDYMYRKFNKNIHFDVCVIFHTSPKQDNWLWTFFITKQLLSKVLNYQSDTLSVLEIFEDRQEVSELIHQIPLNQIEAVIHPFLDMMLESQLNLKDQFKQRENQLNEIYTKNTFNNYEMEQNFSQVYEKLYLSSIKKDQNEIIQINEQQEEQRSPYSPKQFNYFLTDNIYKSSSNNLKSNTPSEERLVVTKYNQNCNDSKLLLTEDQKSPFQTSKVQPTKQQLNSFMFTQFQIHEGDSGELSSCSMYELMNQQSNQNKIIQNFYFHLTIRKALQQLLTTEQIKFQAVKQNIECNSQINYNYSQNEQCQSQNYQEKDHFSKKYYLEVKYKFIIFSTQSIQIVQNSLFEELCQILSKHNIQILIFTTEKGNNFLEKQSDQIYWYHNKIIIRIFYEIQSLLNYLNSKRDPFQREAQITFIQHY